MKKKKIKKNSEKESEKEKDKRDSNSIIQKIFLIEKAMKEK